MIIFVENKRKHIEGQLKELMSPEVTLLIVHASPGLRQQLVGSHPALQSTPLVPQRSLVELFNLLVCLATELN